MFARTAMASHQQTQSKSVWIDALESNPYIEQQKYPAPHTLPVVEVVQIAVVEHTTITYNEKSHGASDYRSRSMQKTSRALQKCTNINQFKRVTQKIKRKRRRRHATSSTFEIDIRRRSTPYVHHSGGEKKRMKVITTYTDH
jgi:hypothetical protein